MTEPPKAPSLADLAPEDRELLRRLLEREGLAMPGPSGLRRRPDAQTRPLSFAQERMWFLHTVDPQSSLYNIPAAVRLVGPLDAQALGRALEAIVERHEVLRTGFETVEGKPLSRLSATARFSLVRDDLGALSLDDREAELARRVSLEAQRPFDLTQAPLLRATLLRLGEEQHALLLTMHHIISDAWSIGVAVRELATLYEAFTSGRASPLLELPVQYADFAHWQRGWLQGQELDAQVAYWKKALAGPPPVLELPTDHPRPAFPSSRGAVVRRTLGPDRLESLKQLSRREGATLFMVLLAGFQALLSRYSGLSDVVVGSPIAGRTRGELEGLIGFFVNTLVLRTDLSGDPTFRELVGRMKETALQAYAHQDLPFEKLVEELKPVRTLSHAPLFQVAFNLQNAPLASLRLRGLTLTPLETTTGTAKVDLAIYLTESATGLRMACEYRTDLFEGATVERMLGHYEGLLRGVVSRPEGRLSELVFLDESERRQVLLDWNATGGEYPRERCFHEVFSEEARTRPEGVAAGFGGEFLSYGELERRSNQLARYLRRRGVGPEVLVGLCVEKSLDLVVGLLGILKAGGGYVPLDPAYPQERLRFMVSDSGVGLVVTQESLRETAGGEAELVLLDAEGDEISLESGESLESGASPENVAYVIYTSGSTGIPKGVVVPHRGLVSLTTAQRRHLGVGRESVVLQFSSLSFDASIFEIAMALSAGGRLCLAPRESLLPGPPLLKLLREEGVSIVTLPPSALSMLGTEPLPALKVVTVAGEACSGELVRRWSGGRKFFNLYGPTEATIWATYAECTETSTAPPIGRPIVNVRVYVLDRSLQPVPVGVPGELCVGGVGVARGYLNRPELTAERFVPDPFGAEGGERLYRTGDWARYRADGNLEFLGRIDHQVKVRGYRIEPGEVETVLARHPRVKQCVVVVREDVSGDKRLVGYVVWRDEAGKVGDLREHLREKLPEYMVPSVFVVLNELPLSPSGKVARGALPEPGGRREIGTGYVEPVGEVERAVAKVWGEILGIGQVGLEDNFFDLGGHSLLLVQVHSRLQELYPEGELRIVDLFRYPTVRALSEHLGGGKESTGLEKVRERARLQKESRREAIAIVGMAGRFPRARDLEEFWKNLRSGEECVTFFTEDELKKAGVSAATLETPGYVRARAVLEGTELFDASFFGYTPRDAEVMDPQHRVFLECAWEAIENAGYDTDRYPGLVGVYAGVSLNRYLLQLVTNPDLLDSVGGFSLLLGSDKDFLPTRVSYKLNLRGPSVNVQTACSTSLVAVHLACQALWNRECDMALAGGVSIGVPQQVGYQYQEEGIGSPDGHCRPFDTAARGTVSGSGVGIVVLKRLEDALRDGDSIRAVIRGSAINNDGAHKIGYTAPSITGQAEVIATALTVSGVAPETIGYVEAHGTGTALGDPVEVEALSQAFGGHTGAQHICALGSLKGNLGHLDAAAGVAGLIKTVLALENREIPPTVNFNAPNPKIDFAGGPFRVNATLTTWESIGPRRAGVSSFGIGGTNAHVVLEEAPTKTQPGHARMGQLIVLSARSAPALEEVTRNLHAHLDAHPEASVADVAHTLQVGRRAFAHRRAIVARDYPDALAALADPSRFEDALAAPAAPGVVFLFPGQGAQHVDMGRGLYATEPVFRSVIDECASLLHESLGFDLRQTLYPDAGKAEAARERLGETALTQPALFAVEVALARLWMSLGVHPTAMIGHSLGEYVAAHLSGVFTLPEALQLVAARGRLMQERPRGAMLAVPLSEEFVLGLLGERLCLAAVNAPELCVVSGPTDAVEGVQESLARRGVESRRLATSHAFHSAMMEGALEAFRAEVERTHPKAPRVPFISNVTGDWISPAQAVDPGYWSGHLRACVRFSAGLSRLHSTSESRLLLEVGPGQTLTTMARPQVGGAGPRMRVVASLRHVKKAEDDRLAFLHAVSCLWTMGVPLEWAGAHAGERRLRVALPAYPFERQRYWLEPAKGRQGTAALATRSRPKRARDLADCFYVPSWLRRPRPSSGPAPALRWLLLGTGRGLAARMQTVLARAGQRVITVVEGPRFHERADGGFALRPGSAEDHVALLATLRQRGEGPDAVLHLWSITGPGSPPELGGALDLGIISLMHLARALGAGPPDRLVRIGVLSDGMQDVAGEGLRHPEKAPLIGPCRVAPTEYPNLRCRSVDLAVRSADQWDDAEIDEWLLDVAAADLDEVVVAYRGGERFVQSVEPLTLEARVDPPSRLRQNGCYLVTGGLGGIGLAMAERLARTVSARLVLTGRSSLPAREAWASVRDEPTRRRIDRLTALEGLGAEVLTVVADVADAQAMREAFDAAEARFGHVDGVVHAAGVPGGGSLEVRTRDEVLAVLRPKIAGTLVLDALVRERGADFLVLCSSLASVLGGFGQSDYCGANAFLDAWARRGRTEGGPFTVSINWDRWREVGMAADAELPKDLVRARARELDRGLETAEGAEALLRVLRERQAQVLVSTLDLKVRLERRPAADRDGKDETGDDAGAQHRGESVTPRHTRPSLATPFAEARDQWERAVAAVFEELLGFAPIGVHDGFFELGGHSLLATQVLTRLNTAYGSRLTLRGLFDGGTVAALAEQIRGAALAPEAATPRVAPAQDASATAGESEATALSFAQERMWFLDRLQPGNPAFNLGLAFRCRGPLDVAVLERALQEIVSRHEVLRTRFPESDGGPSPLVDPMARLEWRRLDLSQEPSAVREGEAAALAAEELRRPFDLSRASLLRATCIRLEEGDHVVLLGAHHIVTDGWSMGIITKELGTLYAAYAAGSPSPLPPLSARYRAYARQERERSRESAPDPGLDYWRRQLKDAPPVLELPTDRDPDPSRPGESGSETLELGEAIVSGLREMGQREGVTSFMLLLAGFQTLLSRLSGQTDVVVGTAVANRSDEEAEALIGPFLNTLALRVDHSGDPTFRQLLARVRAVTMDGLSHQAVPFERLLEALHPRRDLAHPPLFRVFFNMLSFAEVRLDLKGLVLEPFRVGSPEAKFDLTLYATERPGRIALSASYRADLFEGDSVRRWLSQLERLLDQAVADPDRPMSAFSLVTPEEHVALPDPSAPLAEVEVEVVPRLVESWSVRTPQAVALRQSGRELTYASLQRAATAVARSLLTAGVATGEVVAIEAAPSIGLIASVLGVLRSGGALLMLDASLPPGRRQVMKAQARARFLIVVGSLAEPATPGNDAPSPVVIRVDAETGLPLGSAADEAIPLPDLRGDDPAYVFFTSGTSGQPKGVLGCHKGLGHFVAWQRDTFGVGPGDRSSQLTGLSFDVVMREILLPLASGATLCLPPLERELGPDRVLAWLQAEGVTVLHGVPALARTWLLETPPSVTLPALRLVFMAGEPLTGRLVRRWRSRFPGPARLVNLYGPTETTLAKCFEVVGDAPREGIQPVGRSLPQTQALVLGSGRQPCAVGEAGEIVLRTPYRSLGYMNAPEETRRRFVPNPFRRDPRDLLYLTGDRGRYLADGRLEILGRLDQQVKVRGARVELGEVESVLAQHPAVAECVVVAVSEAEGDARLAAYVVPRPPERPPMGAELRQFLKDRLPEYMVPSAVTFLASLPLTPNGKLDRRALPPPAWTVAARTEATGPRSPVEEQVATIWQELLDVAAVGVHDDFFDLGGHSLLATRVASRLRRHFGVEVPLRLLFEATTVARLAVEVQARLAGGSKPLAPVTARVRPGEEAPASFGQQRLWFLHQLHAESAAYNISHAIRLQGVLDHSALERALREIVRRHSVLRTTFKVEEGRPLQRVAPPQPVVLPLVDLAALAEDERALELRRRVREEALLPFDLGSGPLFRAHLLKVSEEEHALLISMHHTVCDSWSLGVLARELNALYPAFREGVSSPLGEQALQYADYAVWQREQFTTGTLDGQLSYWKNRLAGVSVLDLAGDRPRPSLPSGRGARLAVSLSESMLVSLDALGRSRGATRFMTLLAVFLVLLQRYTDDDDIAVGTPIANRGAAELDGLIGFFVNMLVLRTDLSDTPSFGRLVERVREVALGAYANQDVPFEKLVEELQPERSLGQNPLFQVMFILQTAPRERLALPGLQVGAGPSATKGTPEPAAARFDLTLDLTDWGSRVTGYLEYNTDLFDDATARRMVDQFQALLAEAVAKPERPLAELALVAPEEERLLLEQWNSTDEAFPLAASLAAAFEAQVARTPDAEALREHGRSTDYRSLNAASNRLAHHLRGLGVGPETVVGLCLERSVEAVISLLGILKAGAAFLPLDPSHPPQRLQFMLEDAEARVVVTRHGLAGILGRADVRLVCLDMDVDARAIADESPLDPGLELHPDLPAYVIYTSGSTGRPKGVVGTHRGALNRFHWMWRLYPFGPAEVCAQKTALTFVDSIWEVFGPLLAGVPGVVIPDSSAKDPRELLGALADAGVSRIVLVPSLLRALLASPADALALPSLRLWFTSGETLPVDLARLFRERVPHGRLVNLYGSSEAAADSTGHEVDRELDAVRIPIGRPVSNTRVYVLDASQRVVPRGLPGELYIGGAGLARGYLHRPELTAERFVPNPFGTGSRLYRTGDRARFRADGVLEYLGRVDHQVKVRGVRVELGEVEAALRADAAVRDAVVVAERSPEGARLVAYVVPSGGEIRVSALRATLRERLLEPMVPGAFVVLPALPLTPSGKVDRLSLPAPDPGSATPSFVAPRGPVEDVLAGIWEELLGREGVGADESFFDLGGHSLLATQLVVRMRDLLGAEVPLAVVFEHPTVAGLAQALRPAVEVERRATALLRLSELSEVEVGEMLGTGGACDKPESR